MLSLKVDVAKAFFFDKAIVQKAVDAATRRNLSKFGAFTRRNAKDLLKYRDRPSAPGEPPSVHRTMTRGKRNKQGKLKVQAVSPLREFLYFAMDLGGKVVVIGPARLNGAASGGGAPAALEYGGRSSIEVNGKTVSITVRARPTMAPAFAKAQRDLPEIWRDSVK